MELLERIKAKARKNPKKIVFPESTEPRTLKALEILVKKGIAKPILLGDPKKIFEKAKRIKVDLEGVEIIDYLKSKKFPKYVRKLYALRKKKGLAQEEAAQMLTNEIYFGMMMVKTGHADGLVSGAIHPTSHVLIPAFQIIKTRKKFHRVSGLFLMILNKRLMLFADSAVEINPDAKDLAEIAIDTAETAKKLGIKPKVALLSFSTHGSAKHPLVDKVAEATNIVKYKKPKLLVEGELQVDAAIDAEVSMIKSPKSKIKGQANVLIFPDLQSGNISYKLVERLAKAKAIGPILQGLNKPVNDLSRGCSVEDIVDVTAVTVVQAQGGFTKKVIR